MLQIPPDITTLYQALVFIVVYVVLKRLVFDRFLEALDKRHERTEGAIAEAKRIREETAALRAEHAAAVERSAREAAEVRDEIRRRAEAEERAILDEARKKGSQILEGFRQRVADEVASARKSLEADVPALADQVAKTLLGGAS